MLKGYGAVILDGAWLTLQLALSSMALAIVRDFLNNTFNSLKTALDVSPAALDADTPGLRDACTRLLKLIAGGALQGGTLEDHAQAQAGLGAALRHEVLLPDDDGVADAVAAMWSSQREARLAKRYTISEIWDLSHAMSSTARLLTLGAGDRAAGVTEWAGGMAQMCRLPVGRPDQSLLVNLPRNLARLHRSLNQRRSPPKPAVGTAPGGQRC